MNQNVNYLGGGGSLVLQTIPDEWDRILYGLPIAIFCLSRRFERSACRTRLKHIPFFMTTPFLFFPPNAASGSGSEGRITISRFSISSPSAILFNTLYPQRHLTKVNPTSLACCLQSWVLSIEIECFELWQ